MTLMFDGRARWLNARRASPARGHSAARARAGSASYGSAWRAAIAMGAARVQLDCRLDGMGWPCAGLCSLGFEMGAWRRALMGKAGWGVRKTPKAGVAGRVLERYLSAAIKFALATSMRAGEIIALRWTDVSEKQKRARVREAKNGAPRDVPLSSKALVALEGLDRSTPRVFEGLTSESLKRSFIRLTRNTGIANLHFHDLRHTALTRYAKTGLNPCNCAPYRGIKTSRCLAAMSTSNLFSPAAVRLRGPRSQSTGPRLRIGFRPRQIECSGPDRPTCKVGICAATQGRPLRISSPRAS
ncbi:site-specific integrase [Burkholderia sp. Bp9125]|nr:site-specific integrase [Burkholderia sp. Bp9125]